MNTAAALGPQYGTPNCLEAAGTKDIKASETYENISSYHHFKL